MNQPTRTQTRGFTLIELMVTIGIIALLIAISLPALRGANISAKRTKAMANLRSTVQQFDASANDKGHYPFRAPGELPFGMEDEGRLPPDALIAQWWPEGMIIATSNHFAHEELWPSVLVPDVSDWPTYYETWISPGMPTELPELDDVMGGPHEEFDAGKLISIRYSNSFVARPQTWNAAERGTIDRLGSLRPVSPHEVTFTSSKVMLWDGHLAFLGADTPEQRDGHFDADTPMAFADGHADMKNPLEANEPADNPLNDEWAEKTLSDTKDGVHGRDY